MPDLRESGGSGASPTWLAQAACRKRRDSAVSCTVLACGVAKTTSSFPNRRRDSALNTILSRESEARELLETGDTLHGLFGVEGG